MKPYPVKKICLKEFHFKSGKSLIQDNMKKGEDLG